MKRNDWLSAFALFWFFVGLILPGVFAFVAHDWIWLIPYPLGFILLVVGILVEERKK